MQQTCKTARQRLTLAALASHSISAALLAASIYAVICIERTERIDPDATALQVSPSSMF